MNILNVAMNEVKIKTKNKVVFILLLLMPIFMIAIMGNAMKSTFNTSKSINKFQVIYVNKDDGAIGKALNMMMNEKEVKNYIELVDSNEKEANEKVKDGKYDVAIILGEGTSKEMEKGNKISIEVVSSGKDMVKDFVVSSLVNSFTDAINVQSGIQKEYSKLLPKLNLSKVMENIVQLQNKYRQNYLDSSNPQVGESKKLTSFQYFTASMILFFMLTSGIGVGCSIVKERSERLYSRINSFPVKKKDYLFGKAIGGLVISLLQVIVVIVVTKSVFDVDWGNNYLGIGITLLLMMLISSALGILFSSILNSEKALSSGMSIIIWLIAFLGGGFSGTANLQGIAKTTFYKWSLDSLTDFMVGGSVLNNSQNLMMLTAVIVVLTVLSLGLYNRRASNEKFINC